MQFTRSFSVILPAALAACGTEQAAKPNEQIQVVRSGAAPAPAPTSGSGKCQASQLLNIVGQPHSEAVASQARAASGAVEVLVVRPEESAGAADADRLTLRLNGNGTIVDARCG